MSRIGRYLLIDRISAADGDFWYAKDEALDRPVSIRILRDDDPRVPAVLGAARAAALIDDRRLLRVLDVINVPATDDEPARVAVVSEWASAQTIPQIIETRGPLPADQALGIVTEVAAAVSAGATRRVQHGQLRPSSVLVTDAGEVRVRGLAVDAALRGPLNPALTGQQGDVDALGALLYYLTTGRWPGSEAVTLPRAPTQGSRVLPPSQVNASIPRAVDEIVGRSLADAQRPRGSTNLTDAGAFAAATVVADQAPTTSLPRPSLQAPAGRIIIRIVATVGALAFAAFIGWFGWSLLTSGSPAFTEQQAAPAEDILTSTALPEAPVIDNPDESSYPFERGRSFDPFGDDDGDGKPDRRRGRENHADRGFAIDGNPTTAWTTELYQTEDLEGKPGVGYIVDLGEARDISTIEVTLTEPGADVAIKVSDEIRANPDLWSSFAEVQFATNDVTVRSPRPVSGQYVLVWLTRLPIDPERSDRYRVGISDIVVSG
jgi:serine/threonine protein kinase